MCIRDSFNTHKILDSNLKLLESDRYDLINQDSLKYLENEQLQPFDYVFLDPPFNQGLIPLILSLISKQNLIDSKSKIYVESEFEIDLELLNSNIKYNCTIEKQKKIRECLLLSDKLGLTMKKIAIYPGSFDPITNGHIDVIKRASKLFDEVIIAITQNASKSSFLSIDERVSAAENSISSLKNTKVMSFNSLLVDFAKEHNAQIIIRGLRAVSDFEYEFQLSGMNKRLNSEIETLFMTPSEEFANISSSLVREILLLGGDISPFVPGEVKKILLDIAKK